MSWTDHHFHKTYHVKEEDKALIDKKMRCLCYLVLHSRLKLLSYCASGTLS